MSESAATPLFVDTGAFYARADEDNEGSRKVWEKLGFQKDGVLREQTFNEGKFKDIHIYGVLEDEWR